jgi:hypothetical protein
VRVHCRLAVDWLAVVNDKFSDTEPPFAVDAEARLREGA